MSQVLKLIEKQIASSDLKSRLEETLTQSGALAARQSGSFGPCLTISREHGSGGSELAHLAGQQLGWTVFDSKMVDEIAQAAHIQRRLVQSMDEHAHSLWEQTWRELLLDGLPERDYLRHLGQIVFALGHQGHVVLVGRGAQFFLPPGCALRVRLVAPLAWRIKRVADREKMEFQEARSLVNRKDHERAMFIWKSFNKNSDTPLNYDLVLNTGEISLPGAADIVLTALRAKLGVATVAGRPAAPEGEASVAAR